LGVFKWEDGSWEHSKQSDRSPTSKLAISPLPKEGQRASLGYPPLPAEGYTRDADVHTFQPLLRWQVAATPPSCLITSEPGIVYLLGFLPPTHMGSLWPLDSKRRDWSHTSVSPFYSNIKSPAFVCSPKVAYFSISLFWRLRISLV
jgi:hypothetical protein